MPLSCIATISEHELSGQDGSVGFSFKTCFPFFLKGMIIYLKNCTDHGAQHTHIMTSLLDLNNLVFLYAEMLQ